MPRPPTLTRRTFVLAAAAVVAAPPAIALLRERGYDKSRRDAYVAIVEGLALHGALPDGPAAASGAGDRLRALYAGSLPARRREMDEVLDALAAAHVTRLAPRARVHLLREWAAAGGRRRALAARATALVSASFGALALPVDL